MSADNDIEILSKMSRNMRKPAFCIFKNKDAGQLAETAKVQRLCFLYTDSTIPLLLKSEISSFPPLCSLVCVCPDGKPGRFSHDVAQIGVVSGFQA